MIVSELLDRIYRYVNDTVIPTTDKSIIKFKLTAYKKLITDIKNNYLLSSIITYNVVNEKMTLSTGMKAHLKEIFAMKISKTINKASVIEQLLEINGIGRDRADELYNVYNVRKITDLKKRKIFETLPIETKYHITYPPMKQIPHELIKNIEKRLKANVLMGITHYIVGSYRRKKISSRDVDIMIISKNEMILNTIIKKLQQYKFKYHIYSNGKDKFSGIFEYNDNYIKMDFFRTNPIEAPYMLLYSTGSKEFNLKMRAHAKQMGYLLNQKGLYYANDKEKLVKNGIKSEKEIFKVLNMPYTPPIGRIAAQTSLFAII